MRTLGILFIVSSYIASLQSVTYTDLKVLYRFVCARLANVSILYRSIPQLQLNYDADVSDCESVTKSHAHKNKIFRKKKIKDVLSVEVKVKFNEEPDIRFVRKVLETRPRKRKKTKDMFDFF